jgi:excisionase family DNA binding protein
MSTRSPSADWQTFKTPMPAELPALLDVGRMPLAAMPALLVQIASAQARLGALEAAIAARLSGPTGISGEAQGPECEAPLTLEEAARLLKKSTSWVRRAVRRGELGFARRVGRTLLFPRDGMRTYLEGAVPCYGGGSRSLGSKAGAPRRGHRPGGWRLRPRKEGSDER